MKMRRLISLLAPTLCIGATSVVAEDLTFVHPSGATATFYGQVNLTFQGIDDGEETYQEFVDNSNSVSRVGLWIDVPMADSKFRFNFETALGILNTAETDQIGDPDWIDWQRTDIRKLEGVVSGAFGAIWFGQGSMATDGAAEIDNSGTSVAGYVNLADTAGSFQFRDGEALSGISIGDAFKDFDGPRRFRLRYDTPEWSGFYVSAAYGQEVLAEDDDADYYDIALRYGLENDVVALDAAVGYAWKDADDATTEQLIASGSITHVPTGLNLTLAAGDSQDDAGNYGYVKLGWNGQVLDVGGTALSVDYYEGADFALAGSSSSSWGVQAVQTFDAISLEAYLGYRSFAYDDGNGGDFQDLTALLVGARWRF
jgi:hypothetical protein